MSIAYYLEEVHGIPTLTIITYEGVVYHKPMLYENFLDGNINCLIRPSHVKRHHEARYCNKAKEIYLAYIKHGETIIEKMYGVGKYVHLARYNNNTNVYEDLGRLKHMNKPVLNSL